MADAGAPAEQAPPGQTSATEALIELSEPEPTPAPEPEPEQVAQGAAEADDAMLDQIMAGAEALLLTVRALPARLSALSIFHSASVCVALFCRGAGCLPSQNVGFDPGQRGRLEPAVRAAAPPLTTRPSAAPTR
jgi:hypothetical protein